MCQRNTMVALLLCEAFSRYSIIRLSNEADSLNKAGASLSASCLFHLPIETPKRLVDDSPVIFFFVVSNTSITYLCLTHFGSSEQKRCTIRCDSLPQVHDKLVMDMLLS